jgi:hypothetical protein
MAGAFFVFLFGKQTVTSIFFEADQLRRFLIELFYRYNTFKSIILLNGLAQRFNLFGCYFMLQNMLRE